MSLIDEQEPIGSLVWSPSETGAIWALTDEDILISWANNTSKTVSKVIGPIAKHRLPAASTVLTKSLRKEIIAAARFDFGGLAIHFPMHRLTPELELLRLAVSRLSEAGLFFFDDSQSEFEELNAIGALIRELRNGSLDPTFMSARKNFRRKLTKNHQGLLLHFEQLASQFNRILAIRIDFSYQKAASWPADTRTPVRFEEIKQHRRHLLNWIKKKFKMVGFAWRLEYGLHKGYHYHFLLLLNGDKHQQAIKIGMQIGKYWTKEITNGKGLYWNCNAKHYLHSGVGMIHHRDTQRAKNFLAFVLPYLTKPDALLEFIPADGSRTFGRSEMKGRRATGGRPRKS